MMLRLFRFRFWPMGILIYFTAFVAVNLAIVSLAFRHPPALVSGHYYADGLNLRQIAERDAASHAAGWIVKVASMPLAESDKPLVELRISNLNGTPCDSLTGTAAFYRPSNQTLDIAPLPLHFAGTGRYFVVLPRPLEHGAWEVDTHFQHGRQESATHVSLFAEDQR